MEEIRGPMNGILTALKVVVEPTEKVYRATGVLASRWAARNTERPLLTGFSRHEARKLSDREKAGSAYPVHVANKVYKSSLENCR